LINALLSELTPEKTAEFFGLNVEEIRDYKDYVNLKD
jgi:hypothetical protein